MRLLDHQDGVRPSRLSAEQLIDEVNQQDGFIFAAHCTNDNGLLKIGQMNHVWQHQGLLAAQLPGAIEDLRGVENDFYRKVFLNKEANYKREREMAAINAADVEAEVERLPKLLDQAKQYQALGIEKKLKIIPKLEKEKQLKARVDEDVTRVKDAIEVLKDSLPDTVF